MKPYHNEYRCTRNWCYAQGTLGATDTSARQGHYIQAETKEEALARMAEKFPDEKEAGFTAELWRESQLVRMEKALKVITSDEKINDWLTENDPKALQQCSFALLP